MRADILQSSNSDDVREYVNGKFRQFSSWTYTKDRRDRKCATYYVCASDPNKRIVESVYVALFRTQFPTSLANKVQADVDSKARGPVKVARADWLAMKKDRRESAQALLKELIQWKKNGDYQDGEVFFLKLQSRVAEFDSSLLNPKEFLTEKEIKRVATITGNTKRTAREVAAEFEGMIGIQQKAKVKFKGYHPQWGTINTALKQDFKLGAWASGSAKAALEKTGFDLEAQAVVAMGGELNIDGSCTWKLADHGLNLSGNCNLFAGAQGTFSAQLSADLFDGVNASLEAGAFAGVKASVSGKCEFTYDGKTLAEADASASVQFGVGGTLSGQLKVPIFGATQIGFSTSGAIGLGFGVSTNTQIQFSQIYLAGKDDFRRLVYLPTIAKGYRMDLMTQDAKNLHYLEKCIARVGDGVTGLEEEIASAKKIPQEKRGLLEEVADDD